MRGSASARSALRTAWAGMTIALAIGSCTFGLLIAPGTADSTIARASVSSTLRLEVHLDRRQVVLYRGDVAIRQYAIGVGRSGWETPTGDFQIMQMKRNPLWINPFTNEPIPASDPRNPLGGYWIGFWTNGNNWVGFHGTLDDRTVGQAASHGCLHMYSQDLRELYSLVNLGTPVKVMQ